MTNTKSRRSSHLPPGFTEVPVSPEQAAIWRAEAEKANAFNLEFGRRVDRAIGIRDGLIAPPWMNRKRRRDGQQIARVKEVLRKLFPAEGRVPEHLKPKELWADVSREFRARGWKDVGRDTVRRARQELS
jgi:hypothetical protein